MTTPNPDIIEQVRELAPRWHDGDLSVEEIVEHFPFIAEALLKAVEALEAIDVESGDEPASERIARDALSSIRSL